MPRVLFSQVHQFGQYGPEVVKALAHIHELQTGYFANDPDMIKHMDLIQKGTTPSERRAGIRGALAGKWREGHLFLGIARKEE